MDNKILDKFLKLEAKLNDYSASYFEYQNCQKNYQELVNQKKEIEDKRDFLIFQLSELEKIQIQNVDEELAYIEEVQSQKLLNDNKEAIIPKPGLSSSCSTTTSSTSSPSVSFTSISAVISGLVHSVPSIDVATTWKV